MSSIRKHKTCITPVSIIISWYITPLAGLNTLLLLQQPPLQTLFYFLLLLYIMFMTSWISAIPSLLLLLSHHVHQATIISTYTKQFFQPPNPVMIDTCNCKIASQPHFQRLSAATAANWTFFHEYIYLTSTLHMCMRVHVFMVTEYQYYLRASTYSL